MATTSFNYLAYLGGDPSGGGGGPVAPAPAGYNYDYATNFSTFDPQKADRLNWIQAADQSKQLGADLTQQQDYASQLENFYRTPMDVAAGQLGQTPGYSAQELQNITRGQQYQQGETTPGQYASMAPTGSEYRGMAGNPYSLMDFFGARDQANLLGDVTQAAQYSRNDLGAAGNTLNQAVRGQQAGYGSAIDPTKLTVDPALQGQLQATVGGASGAINAAVNNPDLQLNLKPSDYLMSNAQVQQTVNQAAESVKNSQQAQMDMYRRQALASGNADPMALSALATQMGAQGNEAAANAETNAYLAATGQQRGLAMNYAQAQLGAGQTQAGLQTGAQENLLAQSLGEQMGYQGLRIGAQQGLTADQMAAIQNMANTQVGAGEYLGSTGIGLEQAAGAQKEAAQQYVTNTGTGIMGNINQLQTQFANQQYQNRLQNAMYQQQNTFNQNTAVQDRQSAAYQAAANARRQGQGEFLNWSTGQTGQAVGQGQTATQQQLGLYGTQMGAMNQAAGQWGNYNLTKATQPGLTQQIIGGLAGAAAGFA